LAKISITQHVFIWSSSRIKSHPIEFISSSV